jgi:hypothetical protein
MEARGGGGGHLQEIQKKEVCTYMYIFIYIHTNTNTYICIYMHIYLFMEYVNFLSRNIFEHKNTHKDREIA